MRGYLHRCTIWSAKISGIGPFLKGEMAKSGITCAASIERSKVLRIPGFGHFRADSLLDWRKDLEMEALRSAPSRLSRLDVATIENKFFRQRQTLETERQRLQDELTAQVACFRKKAVSVQESLAHEEQRLSNQAAQESARLKQSHAVEVSALDRQLLVARKQFAPVTDDLTGKIRAAQKRLFAVQWQIAKQEQQRQRFSSLRFRDYLKCVAGINN